MRISSQARTDSQARALTCTEPKAVPSAVVPRVLAEDRDCVVNVQGVPDQKLARALKWTKEPDRALHVAVRSTAAGGPEGGQSGLQGTEPPAKVPPWPDEPLSVVDKPLVADAFVVEGGGVVGIPECGVHALHRGPSRCVWCQARILALFLGWWRTRLPWGEW